MRFIIFILEVFIVRRVQLPAGGPLVCQGGVLLHHHHLPAHLDDRGGVLVLILD